LQSELVKCNNAKTQLTSHISHLTPAAAERGINLILELRQQAESESATCNLRPAGDGHLLRPSTASPGNKIKLQIASECHVHRHIFRSQLSEGSFGPKTERSCRDMVDMGKGYCNRRQSNQWTPDTIGSHQSPGQRRSQVKSGGDSCRLKKI